MEFDQYLQPCDASDSRYLTVYDSVSKAPPLINAYRAAKSTGSPSSPTEDRRAAGDVDKESPRESRCMWDCEFDIDDPETILTSETVSFKRLLTLSVARLFRLWQNESTKAFSVILV